MAEQTVFSEMWKAYRGVILHSIVTSFGLDFIVRDQHGGDVDTIHGVRETGQYKNVRNAKAYEARGEYDRVAYHHNDAYDSAVRAARDTHAFFDDAYVPGNKIYYGKASALRDSTSTELGTRHKANLDHVIAAHEIHEDRGRVLAGIDGVELANTKSNLQFTNEQLNKSKGDMPIEKYIQWRIDRGEPLPDNFVTQMRDKDSAARKEYEHSIAEAYYSSDRFIIDAGVAAAKRGLEMGARQAIGFVFIEIWCACEDEIKALPSGVSFSDCMKAVATGIQKGFENAKSKYKDLLAQFEQGFIAGAMASLTTTLINIFITTDKNMVRYIRQSYTTVVQVGNILLINPDDLLLGDQLKAAMASLTTGASVIAGTAVGNQIAKTPIGQDKKIGMVVQNFCASLVSGLISCTLLIMIDRSEFIRKVVEQLNTYESAEHEIRETSESFIAIAAEIAQYDMTEFTGQVTKLDGFTRQMLSANDDELHHILLDTFEEFDVPLPWDGDFDDFMDNPDNCLVFE